MTPLSQFLDSLKANITMAQKEEREAEANLQKADELVQVNQNTITEARFLHAIKRKTNI